MRRTDDQAYQIAYDACLPAFREFVNASYGASELAFSILRPGDDSWESDANSAGLCYIADLTHETTGSLEDVGR